MFGVGSGRHTVTRHYSGLIIRNVLGETVDEEFEVAIGGGRALGIVLLRYLDGNHGVQGLLYRAPSAGQGALQFFGQVQRELCGQLALLEGQHQQGNLLLELKGHRVH